jgi:hypothetical protein
MNFDQYTNDAICRAMGRPAFVEPAWSPRTLRLLLKPSFHSEVCVTIAVNDCGMSVVAFAEGFGRQSVPCELPTFREHGLLAASVVEQLVANFNAALAADRNREGRMVCIDGMGVACCLVDPNGVEQFSCHPYRPEVARFVSSCIQAAWQECRNPGVRNALAACGDYVGLKLPRDPEVVPPKLFRIGVLGTPHDRADFLKQLHERTGRA